MHRIPVTFIIPGLSEGEIDLLNDGYEVISKMILSPDDDRLFRYGAGDRIQVETQNGNRLWCRIRQIERVEADEQVVLIFTLACDKK